MRISVGYDKTVSPGYPPLLTYSQSHQSRNHATFLDKSKIHSSPTLHHQHQVAHHLITTIIPHNIKTSNQALMQLTNLAYPNPSSSLNPYKPPPNPASPCPKYQQQKKKERLLNTRPSKISYLSFSNPYKPKPLVEMCKKGDNPPPGKV